METLEMRDGEVGILVNNKRTPPTVFCKRCV